MCRMKAVEKYSRKGGQVMLEYIMAVAIFMGAILLGAVLYDAFQSYGDRALNLIGSEYP